MGSELLQTILSFPFKQIGELLRWLSLSSGVGNIVAWLIYIGICMIPVTVLAVKLIKKKFHVFDLMLLVVAIAMAIVIYAIINPTFLMINIYWVEEYDIQMAVLGGFVYSMIVGYIVLLLLRKFQNADKKVLCRWGIIMLCIVSVVMVANIILTSADTIESIKKINRENENLTYLTEDMVVDKNFDFFVYEPVNIPTKVVITNIFLLIRCLMDITPSVTIVTVIGFVCIFLKKYGECGVCKETLKGSMNVQKAAIISIIINVLANVFSNFIQLVFYKLLLDTYASVEFPLMWLIFILGMSLVTKLITVSKEIKEENEMFV